MIYLNSFIFCGTICLIGQIILDKTKLDMELGESDSINATVKPDTASDKTVTYTSEDPTVATVDSNGVVTATGVGTTHIVVENSPTVYTRCEVTVNYPKATGVTVNVEDNITLALDGEQEISATVLPVNARENTKPNDKYFLNKFITFSSFSTIVTLVTFSFEDAI